ncbi:MAG: enoyl-CoA hydratase [Thermodesulfobacteriota bacterium]|nr:enoyl-CoA hydratase [Thermodesulfobacteriota bacterium]
MEKPVLFEIKDGVALITLNRPNRHNAINRDLLVHLTNYIEKVAGNDGIRVAILTGNGKSFCSGIDLDEAEIEALSALIIGGTDFPDAIAACKKPIIGAINGPAITGGFEIALNCDFLIASEMASFKDTHAMVGIHPGWGMTQLLQQAVGQRMAKQISFTSQTISADKAFKIGLVNEVVSHEELIPRAKQIASEICAVNQDMLVIIKGLINFRNNATLDEAFAHERKGMRDFAKKNTGRS